MKTKEQLVNDQGLVLFARTQAASVVSRILGPLLFLLYINDLPNCLSDLQK